jgi:hypothetical protein
MKTYSTVSAKAYNRATFIVCGVITLIVIIALITGNINGFNNTYLSK